MTNTQSVLTAVRRFAAQHNWTTIYDKMGCTMDIIPPPGHGRSVNKVLRDTILAFRMPLPITWRQTSYSTSWFG